MSLDVYLEVNEIHEPTSGEVIVIRENGEVTEISREEWERRFPGRKPVVVSLDDVESRDVFEANITHNLNRMAREAGLYEALWHPAELDPVMAERIGAQVKAGNYHGVGGAYELEGGITVKAKDLIAPMERGLALLLAAPERFKVLNPPNGWGSYDGLVDFVERYLEACRKYPHATVRVSR